MGVLGGLTIAALTPVFARGLVSRVMNIMNSQTVKQMMVDFGKVVNFPFGQAVQQAQRAKTGKPLEEPFGPYKEYKSFAELMFVPAQLSRVPHLEDVQVDVSVTVGKQTRKPFTISTPVMFTGMGYGVSLSKSARLALAKASTLAGTSVTSGEGGFLAEERLLAKHYVLQYVRSRWSSTPEILRRADMIEIKYGQGAQVCTPFTVEGKEVDEEKARIWGVNPGQPAYMPARFPDVSSPDEWKRLVDQLRDITGGVPIALKLAAGDIEGDLEIAVNSGVDVLVIDGAEGGTAYSFDVTLHDFGVPTLYAIPRAAEFLRERGVKDKITVIAAGGLRTPGDFLKAMALGADAVYIGRAALMAMSYAQWPKVLPYAQPYTLFLYNGRHIDKLDVEQAAHDLANFVNSCTQEMAIAARALGKASLRDVNRDDLCALTEEVARMTGVRPAYREFFVERTPAWAPGPKPQEQQQPPGPH